MSESTSGSVSTGGGSRHAPATAAGPGAFDEMQRVLEGVGSEDDDDGEEQYEEKWDGETAQGR